MAKNVLRRQFSNMYGKDKPFQENSNVKLSNVSNFTESNNQMKRVIKNEFKNVYGENTNANAEKTMFPEIKPSNITVSAIIFLTVLIILASILYYYRNNIFDFFKKTNEIRQKFFNYAIKYQKNPTKFFEDEFENFNFVANKMLKKISKLYAMAKDDEQVSESIINWELHQQIIEKKYGKRKIETKYKNWNLK